MNILILDSVGEVITATLTEAQTTAMDITVSYGDSTLAGMTEGVQLSASNGTTAVTICSSPAASTRRLIRNITVYNKDNVVHTIIFKLYSGGIYYGITKKSVVAGETWSFGEGSTNLLAYADGTDLDTGTDNYKYATSKAIKDSHNVPSVAPGTTGNILESDGTDWKSVARPNGFTLQGLASQFDPIDSTDYYIGQGMPFTPSPFANVSRVYVPKASVLKAVFVYWDNQIGTPCSSENISMYVDKNAGTTTLIQTIGNTGTTKLFSKSDLSLSFNGTTDYVQVKMLGVTWVTNPTAVNINWTMYFEGV